MALQPVPLIASSCAGSNVELVVKHRTLGMCRLPPRAMDVKTLAVKGIVYTLMIITERQNTCNLRTSRFRHCAKGCGAKSRLGLVAGLAGSVWR